MKDRKKRTGMVLAVLFWLALWQTASSLIDQELFLVSPLKVASTLLAMTGEAAFWRTVGYSFAHIELGFLLAMVFGVALAVAAARYGAVRALLSPIMAVIKATPVVSFIILAVLFVAARNLSILIAFLIVLPVMYSNTLEGIDCADKKLLEMAEVFGLGRLRRLLYIYMPAVKPFFVSACAVGLGLCWKSGVSAEVIGLPNGTIGEQLYQSKLFFDTAGLLAWTVVIIAVSALFEKLFMWALKKALNAVDGNLARGPEGRKWR